MSCLTKKNLTKISINSMVNKRTIIQHFNFFRVLFFPALVFLCFRCWLCPLSMIAIFPLGAKAEGRARVLMAMRWIFVMAICLTRRLGEYMLGRVGEYSSTITEFCCGEGGEDLRGGEGGIGIGVTGRDGSKFFMYSKASSISLLDWSFAFAICVASWCFRITVLSRLILRLADLLQINFRLNTNRELKGFFGLVR